TATTTISPPFIPLPRQIKAPVTHQRESKAYHDRHHDQSQVPIWNIEKRKDLRDALSESPAGNRVCDRDFVNVAPLQLGEEISWIHSARLHEALVTPPPYLFARDLKSACNTQNASA